eukprot:RCo037882
MVLLLGQCHLEPVLRAVNRHGLHLGIPVQVANGVAHHPDDVDGVLQGLDRPGVPRGQAVLQVIQRGVQQHPRGLVERRALHSAVLVQRAQLLHLAVCHHNRVLPQKGHAAHVGRPHCVLHLCCGALADDLLLADVKQADLVITAGQHLPVGRGEQEVRRPDRGQDFHNVVVLVPQHNLLGFVQHDKLAPREEHRGRVEPFLDVIGVGPALGDGVQLKRPSVVVVVEQGHSLRRAVRHRQRGVRVTPQLQQRLLRPGVQVQRLQLPLLDPVQGAADHGVRRALPFQLEHDHPRVVPGSDEVAVGVHGEDPEAVGVPPEGVDGGSLLHVPDSDGAVLGVADDVVPEVRHAANVVDMSTQLLNLKPTRVVHLPDANGAVVGSGDNQGVGRVEGGPVHALLVALQDELHHDIVPTEELLVDVHVEELGGAVLLLLKP